VTKGEVYPCFFLRPELEVPQDVPANKDSNKKGRSMLASLKQRICETCGKIINSPEDGWVEWLDNGGGFLIFWGHSGHTKAASLSFFCFDSLFYL